MNYTNSYEVLSRFYGKLIDYTGRLNAEKELIIKLFDRYSINKESIILDGACGTGHILQFLKSKGYKNIQGLDGSKKMCQEAKKNAKGIPIHNFRWENLISGNGASNLASSFDFIFILSNSFLHIDEKDLELVLRNLKTLLKKDGILILDIRKWQNTEHGLREFNRPGDVYRWKGDIVIDNKEYIIDDSCSYTKNRQIITYRISEKPLWGINTSNFKFDSVSYALLDYRKIVSLALEENIYSSSQVLSVDDWPYYLISLTR